MMLSPWTVFFDTPTLDRILHLATERSSVDRKENYKVADDQTDLELDTSGLLTEFGFAHFYERDEDAITDVGRDLGWDFVLDDGLTVDTKGTSHPRAWRCPNRKRTIKSSYIVAGWSQKPNRCQLMGWLSSKEWRNMCEPFGTGFGVPWSEMHRMNTFDYPHL